ncbi:MAG: zinc ribbon domain-containing protein [Halobacteriaceae archaeon]
MSGAGSGGGRSNGSARRGLVAALLAFVYPGVGHLYLREWRRALGWFLASFLVGAVVVLVGAPDAMHAVESQGLSAMSQVQDALSTTELLPVMAIRALNIADAYLIGARGRAPGRRDGGVTDAADGPTCPNCGKELDEDLDFCPWCTTRLDGEADADAVTSR